MAYYTFADIFDGVDSEEESPGASSPVSPVLGAAMPATPVLKAAVPASPVLGAADVFDKMDSESPGESPMPQPPATPVLGTVMPASPVLSPAEPADEIPISAVLGGPGPGEAGPSNWYVRQEVGLGIDEERAGSPTLGRSVVYDFGWGEDEEEEGGG